MKKRYFVILFILIPFLLLAGKTNAGIRVGMNFATLIGFGDEFGDEFADNLNEDDAYSNFKSSNIFRKPLTLGLFVSQEIYRKFSLQGEFNISNKGIAIRTEGLYVDKKVIFTTIYKINYIDLPVLVKLNISKEKNKKFNIYAGPSISMLSSSKIYMKVKIVEEENDDEIDVKGYKEVDYGLILGFDAFLPSNVIFDFRYSLGMTDILDGNLEAADDRDEDSVEFSNSVFNFSVGFWF